MKQITRLLVLLGLLAAIYSLIPLPFLHADGQAWENPPVDCPCHQWFDTNLTTLGNTPFNPGRRKNFSVN